MFPEWIYFFRCIWNIWVSSGHLWLFRLSNIIVEFGIGFIENFRDTYIIQCPYHHFYSFGTHSTLWVCHTAYVTGDSKICLLSMGSQVHTNSQLSLTSHHHLHVQRKGRVCVCVCVCERERERIHTHKRMGECENVCTVKGPHHIPTKRIYSHTGGKFWWNIYHYFLRVHTCS
jgi:hypothetical protein